MKTVTPDMDVDKQIRKGMTIATQAMCRGEIEKATYATYLVGLLVKSVQEGQPRPWSEFSPMMDEEFS